jgi:hypothetical protein
MDDDLRQLLEVMRQENAAAHVETRRHSADLFTNAQTRMDRLEQENAAAHAETRRHSADLFTNAQMRMDRLEQENAAAHAETQRLFGSTAEGLRSDIRLLADAIATVDEKYDRRYHDVIQRMERGFADTQAMIKFSHAELDRRMTALEVSMADLQARVTRLESSPQ